MEQIKMCPFCGSEKANFSDLITATDWWVTCEDCGSTGPLAKSNSDAVLLWNAAANQIEACQSKIFELETEVERLKNVVKETEDTARKYYINWQAELRRVAAGDKRQDALEAEIEQLRKELDELKASFKTVTELMLNAENQRNEARAWARKLYRANGLLIDNCITKFARINKITISYEPTDDAQP